MDGIKQSTQESITALKELINTFKEHLNELEPLANSIDYQVYELSDNSLFQFEDYNINEGLDLLHSILSRRIHYLEKKVGTNGN